MQDDPRNSSFSAPLVAAAWMTFASIIMLSYRNSADGRRGDEDELGPPIGHPFLDIGLPTQIELGVARDQELTVLLLQSPAQSRSDHAGMARHPDSTPFQLGQSRLVVASAPADGPQAAASPAWASPKSSYLYRKTPRTS